MEESRERVLIADAERFFREAIAEALGEAGIPCDAAESAAEAWRGMAREPRIGAALVDLALPGGPELARRLCEERPEIRVVVLSTPAEQDLVLEALRAGAFDYLAKPLHDEELVLCVRRALAAAGLERAYERLRGRLRSADAWIAELGAAARSGQDFAACVAEAVADVLGATKTSLMLLADPPGGGEPRLAVVAATGSSLAPEEMESVAPGEGIAGLALGLEEGFAVDDVAADPRLAGRPFRHRYDSGALAVMPLHSGGRPVGVLCAADREGAAPFGDDERALLRLLASHTSELLAPAGLVAAGAPRPAVPAAEAELGAELARELCEALTLEIEPARLVAAVLRPVARRLAASPVSLYLFDGRSGDLAREGQWDAEGRVDRARLPRGRGLCHAVLAAGAIVACGRPQSDPRFDPEVDTPEDGSPGPLLCVPLRLRGRVLGIARAFPKDVSAASPRIAEILSAGLSAAVRTLLLYRSLLESIEDLARARRGPG